MTSDSDDHFCDFSHGKFLYTYEYLEKILIEISRYVAIDPGNNDTWSEVLATLLVLNGNAIDTFFRNMVYCPNIQKHKIFKDVKRKPRKKKGWKITHFQKIIEPIHELSENTITAPFGLGSSQEFTPFSDFSSKIPDWWNAYNLVKHDYYDNLNEANLYNVVNSLGALLILHALHKCSRKHLINQYQIIDDWTLSKTYKVEALDADVGITNSFSGYRFYIITGVFRFHYRSEKT